MPPAGFRRRYSSLDYLEAIREHDRHRLVCDHTVVDHHVSKRTSPAVEVSVGEAFPSDQDGGL